MSLNLAITRSAAQEAALRHSARDLGPVPLGSLQALNTNTASQVPVAVGSPELQALSAQTGQQAAVQAIGNLPGAGTLPGGSSSPVGQGAVNGGAAPLTADRFVIGGPGVPSIVQTVDSSTAVAPQVTAAAGVVAGPLPSAAGRAASFSARAAQTRGQMEQALQTALQAGDAQAQRAETYQRLLADPSRQFLDFDPTGDGRIVEVFGDISTADNVSVLIPGINNTVDNFQNFADDAARLRFEAGQRFPGESTAVVAWLDYDTPDTLTAPFNNAAVTAGPALKSFVEGLQLSDSTDTSILAHSYGSLVGGESLRLGLVVDNVGVLGSPGTGVNHVNELGLPEGTSFTAFRALNDPVAWSQNFSLDPSDSRFGAVRADTGEVVGHSHSGYYQAGSTSLANLAKIAVGQPDQVTVREPTALEQAVGVVDDGINIILAPLDVVQEGAAAITGDSDVVEGVNRVVSFARRLVSPDFWVDVGSDLIEVGSRQIGSAIDTVGRFFGNVVDTGSTVVNAIGNAAGSALDTASNIAGNVVDTISDAGSSVVDTVSNFANGAANVAGNVVNAVGNFGAGVLNTAANIGSGIVTGIGNVASAIGSGISTAFNATRSFFSGLFN